MPPFEKCTLKMGEDGDMSVFLGKVSGYGYNDMISLPTLTKDSLTENLKRRFMVRGPPRLTASTALRTSIATHRRRSYYFLTDCAP